MKSLLQTLFFFLLATQLFYAQWFWQNPLPKGNSLNDVVFVDENKGWAIGERGTVLQTVDGGVTWVLRDIGTGIDFKSMSFVDQYNGWLLGASDSGFSSVNRIYKTTNGGADWFIQSEIDTISEFGTISLLSSIFFVNANIGWAIGDVILKTTNGGDDWSYQFNSVAELREFTDCYFIDENTGWILGDEEISSYGCKLFVLKTTNGGTSWNEKQFPDTISYSFKGEIFFINNNLGWATSWGDLCKTIDGGLNWTKQTITDGVLNSIFFLNDQVGYAVGNILDGGQILKTTDGGTSWNEQYFDQMNFSSVFFASAQKGFIVGRNGEILRTTDSGESWIPFYDNFYFNFTKICMVDALNGWAAGDARASCLSGRIVRTTDGGNTWNLIQHPEDSYPTIFFINSQIGWIGGLGSGIWKTTDSGLSWIQQIGYNLVSIEDIFFINENYGWAAKYGSILRTTNGGEIWSDVNTGTTEPIRKIFFLNENMGWAIGLWSIIKTTDSGINWSVQNSPIAIGSESQLSSIYFSHTNNGWISVNLGGTWSGELFATSDGGQTWQTQLTGVFNMELEFIDNNTGYLIGGEQEGLFSSFKSVVYRTTNGGATWVSQATSAHKNLLDISFTDANNGWVVGEGGTILHTTNGGVSFVEEEQIDEIPTEFLLSQNYPNPFNPSTKIKYSVAQSSNVIIKVFDVLGSEIEIIVNEEKPVGTYELNWNAANLPSGVYYYRLQAGDFVQTRKMVLLK